MRLAQNPRETTRDPSQKGGVLHSIRRDAEAVESLSPSVSTRKRPVLLSPLLPNTRRTRAFRGLESLSRRTYDPFPQRSISTRSRPGKLALRSILSPRDILFPSGLR